MKKLPIFGILAVLFILLMSQTPPSPPTPPNPPTGGRQEPPPGGWGALRGQGGGRVVNQDSLIKEREKAMAATLEYIKGKEKMPADSVFKNIKTFKGLPAEKLVGIMGKWSEAIGTGCNGCHNMKDYASDEKDEKETTREMVPMTQKINKDLIQAIKGLEKSKGVSCMTCHRGRKHPN
jgi:Photosynthetic reaction centre cytochrome C subunit